MARASKRTDDDGELFRQNLPFGTERGSVDELGGTPTGRQARRRSRRIACRGEHGVAMVEFALLMPILGIMLFGIIEFGYLMSFRGGLAQGASEGARAAATAPRALVTSGSPLFATYPNGRNNAQAISDATDAVNRAEANYGKTCGTGGLTCQFLITDCGSAIDTPALPDCMTVRLVYDNAGSPVMPPIPLLNQAMPSTLSVSSSVQLNNT